MINETGCDAVMIGRGVLGNPWLIKECVDYLENKIEPSIVPLKEKLDMIKKHLKYLMEIKPEKVAVTEIRSHAAWYLKKINNSNNLKKQIFECKTCDEILNAISNFEDEMI